MKEIFDCSGLQLRTANLQSVRRVAEFMASAMKW
jgi:hypothetical protein